MATGFIMGGVLGAAGLALALSDRGTRKHIAKSGSKAMKKAGKLMDI